MLPSTHSRCDDVNERRKWAKRIDSTRQLRLDTSLPCCCFFCCMLIRRSVSIRPARTAPQSLCHRRRQHTSVRFNTRRPKFSLVNRTTQRHRSTPRPAFLPATRFPQASFSIAEMSSQATSDAAASDPASLVGSYRTESLKVRCLGQAIGDLSLG